MQKRKDIFQRIEKKYLLNGEQYTKLKEKMIDYMEVDNYGLSTICNVYYDTINYELIRTSLESPVYKEKLRIRSYGIPEDNGKTFIELKKKYDGIVYKRRIQLSMKEADNYLEHGIKPKIDSQILNEIDYFITFYHPMKKLYIAYDRVAMFGKEDDSIRITFDQNIRSREFDLDLREGDYGELLLGKEETLMEIKVAGAYPLWLTGFLSELEIYPVSFSKYGRIYQKKMARMLQLHKKQETEYELERDEKICLPA